MKHAQRILLQQSLARAVIAMGRSVGDGPGAAVALAKQLFGSDKAALDIIERGAVVPASTSGVTAFNETKISDLVSLLGPGSASAAIFRYALGVTLNDTYGVKIPSVTASGSGVAFIAQGAPIPVKQFAFSGVTLSPQKVGLVVGFTRELINSSNADTLVRALLAENLALGLDTLLLDATAGDTTRPAGLRNGVSATSATGGGGQAAMVNDLATLAAAVAPVANDEIIFIASPKQAVKIALMRTSALPYPLLSSAGLEDGVVMALAVNALAVAGGNDPPKIRVSTEAVLHFEDASPAAISTVATPNTVAAPVKSLYQSDCIAMRLIADLTWALRTTGAIAWTTSVTW